MKWQSVKYQIAIILILMIPLHLTTITSAMIAARKRGRQYKGLFIAWNSVKNIQVCRQVEASEAVLNRKTPLSADHKEQEQPIGSTTASA